MNQEKNLHKEESMFPVFRFDLENRLVYANVPALPLMKHWQFRMNEKVPAQFMSQYPELFHSSLSHKPTDVTVKYNNYLIGFSIVPFPEAKYIGMYAYVMEVNENYVSKATPATLETVQVKTN